MADPEPKNTPGTPGADPVKPDENLSAFDPSKIKDDDFNKIYEDPRLFNHPRFKELAKSKQELEKIKEKQQKEEEERLKKQGEYETLAKQKEEEAKTWQTKYKESQVNNQIAISAQKLGSVDVNAVLKLIDRSNISVADDGTISGTEEAVKALLTASPYLKGNGQQAPTMPASNPGDTPGDVKRFKASQLRDVEFYRKHEPDILKAMKLGLIENDV